jgi:hypothetical protein
VASAQPDHRSQDYLLDDPVTADGLELQKGLCLLYFVQRHSPGRRGDGGKGVMVVLSCQPIAWPYLGRHQLLAYHIA